MAIDSHYISAFSIETVLLDKDSGAPLSGGLVYFEKDAQRATPKPVYQITGTSPDYSYTALTNPMVLSSIGTFQDSLGNPVVPYFYPYNDILETELYYVRVTSAAGVEQFVRQAVPYISDTGTVPDEIANVITNEITNPQFIEVVFDTSAGSYTYSFPAFSVNTIVQIAPDWLLFVSTGGGAGTVTVTQTTPAGSENIVTNPGAILTISSGGLSSLKLVQRIHGSPNLWGNGYISASFVAKTYSGSPTTLRMLYSQSNGTVTDQTLITATLTADGAYGVFPNSFKIPVSNSTQTYPNAYVDIFFVIPVNTQIGLTSVMLSYTDTLPVSKIQYDQESRHRQIDHLYHYAYPIVPIGTVIDFGGFGTPLHYLPCDGVDYSRVTYNLLFQAMTKKESVGLQIGNPAFVVLSASFYRIGMIIEGIGIPVGARITAVNFGTNTITMSAAAIAPAGLQTVRFFAGGNGNGINTFNVYDLRGYVVAGAGGTNLVTADLSALGTTTGSTTMALLAENLPGHSHTVAVPKSGGGAPNNAFVEGAIGAGTLNIVSNGGQTPGSVPLTTPPTAFEVVQSTTLLNKCIRYE